VPVRLLAERQRVRQDQIGVLICSAGRSFLLFQRTVPWGQLGERAIARFLRCGDGLVAIVAMLGMVAVPVAMVVVLAAVSLLIG
jgi:hypothetical protein